jgi:DNA-directed RNA polymerase subunit RPC12/RpoP
MPHVKDAPAVKCPNCETQLSYTGSLGGGGFYNKGDTFRTALENHHYKCHECGQGFMLTEAKNLIPLGRPEIRD